MPIEAKPLFRPDVLRSHLASFDLPGHIDGLRPKLAHWADLLASGKANTFKEQEILPDFLTDFFCELLGYRRPIAATRDRVRLTEAYIWHTYVLGSVSMIRPCQARAWLRWAEGSPGNASYEFRRHTSPAARAETSDVDSL